MPQMRSDSASRAAAVDAPSGAADLPRDAAARDFTHRYDAAIMRAMTMPAASASRRYARADAARRLRRRRLMPMRRR